MKMLIVSGGGTGGHIYPALALIRTIKEQHPETEVFIHRYRQRA